MSSVAADVCLQKTSSGVTSKTPINLMNKCVSTEVKTADTRNTTSTRLNPSRHSDTFDRQQIPEIVLHTSPGRPSMNDQPTTAPKTPTTRSSDVPCSKKISKFLSTSDIPKSRSASTPKTCSSRKKCAKKATPGSATTVTSYESCELPTAVAPTTTAYTTNTIPLPNTSHRAFLGGEKSQSSSSDSCITARGHKSFNDGMGSSESCLSSFTSCRSDFPVNTRDTPPTTSPGNHYLPAIKVSAAKTAPANSMGSSEPTLSNCKRCPSELRSKSGNTCQLSNSQTYNQTAKLTPGNWRTKLHSKPSTDQRQCFQTATQDNRCSRSSSQSAKICKRSNSNHSDCSSADLCKALENNEEYKIYKRHLAALSPSASDEHHLSVNVKSSAFSSCVSQPSINAKASKNSKTGDAANKCHPSNGRSHEMEFCSESTMNTFKCSEGSSYSCTRKQAPTEIQESFQQYCTTTSRNSSTVVNSSLGVFANDIWTCRECCKMSESNLSTCSSDTISLPLDSANPTCIDNDFTTRTAIWNHYQPNLVAPRQRNITNSNAVGLTSTTSNTSSTTSGTHVAIQPRITRHVDINNQRLSAETTVRPYSCGACGVCCKTPLTSTPANQKLMDLVKSNNAFKDRDTSLKTKAYIESFKPYASLATNRAANIATNCAANLATNRAAYLATNAATFLSTNPAVTGGNTDAFHSTSLCEKVSSSSTSSNYSLPLIPPPMNMKQFSNNRDSLKTYETDFKQRSRRTSNAFSSVLAPDMPYVCSICGKKSGSLRSNSLSSGCSTPPTIPPLFPDNKVGENKTSAGAVSTNPQPLNVLSANSGSSSDTTVSCGTRDVTHGQSSSNSLTPTILSLDNTKNSNNNISAAQNQDPLITDPDQVLKEQDLSESGSNADSSESLIPPQVAESLQPTTDELAKAAAVCWATMAKDLGLYFIPNDSNPQSEKSLDTSEALKESLSTALPTDLYPWTDGMRLLKITKLALRIPNVNLVIFNTQCKSSNI